MKVTREMVDRVLDQMQEFDWLDPEWDNDFGVCPTCGKRSGVDAEFRANIRNEVQQFLETALSEK